MIQARGAGEVIILGASRRRRRDKHPGAGRGHRLMDQKFKFSSIANILLLYFGNMTANCLFLQQLVCINLPVITGALRKSFYSLRDTMTINNVLIP